MPSLRLSTLVSRLGGAVRGDAEAEVREVASLANAGEGQLAFFDRSLSVRCLSDSRAEVIILRAEDAAQTRQTCWLVDGNPRLIFARAAKIIRPPEDFLPVVSPQACVDKRATLGKRVGVGAGAVVGEGAVLGDDCRVHAGVVVGAGAQVGRGTELFAHVVLYPGVTVGDRCTIHAGAVIGADGFGFVADEEGGRQKIPQLGGVRLGDDVEVGANTTIDRGTLDDTVVGSGVKVDNQVQIGHNVRIGENSVVCGCVGIAGSTVIGRDCVIGGGAAVGGHLRIEDGVQVGGFSAVNRHAKAGERLSSMIPALPLKRWQRIVARLRRLP